MESVGLVPSVAPTLLKSKKPVLPELKKVEKEFITFYLAEKKDSSTRSNGNKLTAKRFQILKNLFIDKFGKERVMVLTEKRVQTLIVEYDALPTLEKERYSAIIQGRRDESSDLVAKESAMKQSNKKFKEIVNKIKSNYANINRYIADNLVLNQAMRDLCKVTFDLCANALNFYDMRTIDLHNQVLLNDIKNIEDIYKPNLSKFCIGEAWAKEFISSTVISNPPLMPLMNQSNIIMPRRGAQKGKNSKKNEAHKGSLHDNKRCGVKRVKTIKDSIFGVSKLKNQVISQAENNRKNQTPRKTKVSGIKKSQAIIDTSQMDEDLDIQIQTAGKTLMELLVRQYNNEPITETRYMYMSSMPANSNCDIGDINDQYFIQGNSPSNPFKHQTLIMNIFRATNGFIAKDNNSYANTSTRASTRNKIHDL